MTQMLQLHKNPMQGIKLVCVLVQHAELHHAVDTADGACIKCPDLQRLAYDADPGFHLGN